MLISPLRLRSILPRLFTLTGRSPHPILFVDAQPWIHKRTRDKFHVLGANYQEILRRYIHPDNIPIEYGGACTAVFPETDVGYQPDAALVADDGLDE